MNNPLYDEKLFGDRCEYHDTITSTNIRAKELARNGAAHKTLVLADEQTDGRGRRGRSWLSRAGVGAWMSLILRPEGLAPERSSELVLTTAVAMAKTLTRVSKTGARIKWPNDIVIDGKKVCGMLLEGCLDGDRLAWAVAGIGVNLLGTEFPEDIPYAASVESVTGEKVCRSAFVAEFLKDFDAEYDLWEKDGISAILREYRKYSITIGSMVKAETSEGDLFGRAMDITESGALVLVDPYGERHILNFGDVSVRGVMGYV